MIYALFETDTKAIRYVGYTKGTLQQRALGHYRDALDKNNQTYKARWIRFLWKRGANFGIMPLENTKDIKREIAWIAQLKASGCSLVNCTAGGEGCVIAKRKRRTRKK